MPRPSRAIIDYSALCHNFSRVKSLVKAANIMAVVKADAYGHGLNRVANWLNEADAFGIACLSEAVQLRKVGIGKPIIMLEGAHTSYDIKAAGDLGLDMVLHNHAQLRMLKKQGAPLDIAIWVKIDTGMHRLGFQPSQVEEIFAAINKLSPSKPIRIMTHFAVSNKPEHTLNEVQLSVFNAISVGRDVEKSVANSAAILSMPETHFDWVRPGLMLYGVSPFAEGEATDYGLLPVMTFETEIIAVQSLKKGDSVGYGASWHCPEDMPVGIVAVGYGDGYPRQAKSGTPILVKDHHCSLAGCPSMDMLSVDLRPYPQAKVGDPVTLWGQGLPIEKIAAAAGTIPYEILCKISNRLQLIEK